MRSFVRSAPPRMALPGPTGLRRAAMAVASGGIVLLLSGCAGVGNYLSSTLNPFGDPNAPAGDAVNMQRARGDNVAVQPLRPEPGDVWPGKAAPIPTLGEIQKHMNVPLGAAYRGLYSAPSAGSPQATYSVPPGAKARGLPSDRQGGEATDLVGSAAATLHTSPQSGEAGKLVPRAPAVPESRARAAKPIMPDAGLPVGQTVMGPRGPLGIVSTPSNGRYQTVAPIAGKGGGILISNGNGTATLVQANGQVVTVQTR
ncbi:MAG TPA: hypothetical protein PLV07_05890 [Acidiphilium sp.]|uniref:hypothetical protein n=1 Tax=unclassified Acidiphilium TaxID=2617493 RepID=UPI000BDD4C9E|nr:MULTISPECIES: hypothetical protein [unclassified Acidiphilium]OYV55546.1 MAG: hypothetical protein B7Z76_09530 [Acidiphilium sp. 20-67-58]HQT60131.1 hypothetical protein [Acidiphilium sp.]HQU11094.1 hypothetical protein [Acidiphilium sp.]